jgi:TonB family protein
VRVIYTYPTHISDAFLNVLADVPSMKFKLTAGLLLCLLGTCVDRTHAQEDRWIEVSADTEYFHVSMPHQPRQENESTGYGQINAIGKRYETATDGAGYALWALVNKNFNAFQATDPEMYLDECADLVWEGLLKPGRDKRPNNLVAWAAMSYVKELPPNPLAGREYTVTIGDKTGTVHIYVAQMRIFVLLAMNSPGGVWARQRFLGSFTVMPSLPIQRPNDGDPKSGERTTGDQDQVFPASELTQKVKVFHKPEPTYTEGARKYHVNGTVTLRAVFSKNGEVTKVDIIKRLPHGLTQAAMRVTRGIRFTPAMKDGRPVSQYVELQYNFNFY